MEVKYRLGSFFILVGLGLIFLFWITAQGETPQPEGNLLILGIGSLMFGIWQAWRNRPKPQDVERFKTAKKIFNREKKKKE
jgi:hypothetical protein